MKDVDDDDDNKEEEEDDDTKSTGNSIATLHRFIYHVQKHLVSLCEIV